MRSYKIKPTDLVECSIFIDTRGSRIRVLQDSDLYTKATGQLATVAGLIDGKNLPEGVVKETASFARLSFAIQQEIDANSVEYINDNKDIRINVAKRDQMRIRNLLRDWSLADEEGKKIPLEKVTVSGRTTLTDKSFNLVMNEIEPAIIQGFLVCFDLMERAASEDIGKQAAAELKEGTGIKAKN